MSGTTTTLGVSVAQSDWTGAGQAALLVVLFVTGSFLGQLAARLLPQRYVSLLLALEALLLVSVPLLHRSLPPPLVRPEVPPLSLLIIPLVLAMGAQNAVLKRVGPLSVGLTYVTGALAHLGVELARLVGGGHDGVTRRAGIHALLWLGLAVGEACGGLLYHHFSLNALFAPAGVLLAICLLTRD